MPNRILKESICTSDSVDSLSWFEEVLFYRLIVNCDDYGRFDGRPAIIKNRLFPLKESLTTKAISKAVNTLVIAGLVVLYEFEGKPYLYLPTWNDHQNVRAKRSKYPSPEGCVIAHENICNHMYADVPVIQSESESEYKGDSARALRKLRILPLMSFSSPRTHFNIALQICNNFFEKLLTSCREADIIKSLDKLPEGRELKLTRICTGRPWQGAE